MPGIWRRPVIDPLVLERGEEAHVRQKTVENFWKNGVLDPDSNVQFGEGGAGTFSDGKLNTLVKDPSGRNHEVLKRFRAGGCTVGNYLSAETTSWYRRAGWRGGDSSP